MMKKITDPEATVIVWYWHQELNWPEKYTASVSDYHKMHQTGWLKALNTSMHTVSIDPEAVFETAIEAYKEALKHFRRSAREAKENLRSAEASAEKATRKVSAVKRRFKALLANSDEPSVSKFCIETENSA